MVRSRDRSKEENGPAGDPHTETGPGNLHTEVVIKDESGFDAELLGFKHEGQPVVIKIEEDQFDGDIEDCGETVWDVNLQEQADVIKIEDQASLSSNEDEDENFRDLPTNNDIKSEDCVESEDDPEKNNEVKRKYFDGGRAGQLQHLRVLAYRQFEQHTDTEEEVDKVCCTRCSHSFVSIRQAFLPIVNFELVKWVGKKHIR